MCLHARVDGRGTCSCRRAEGSVGAGFTGVTGHKPPGFLWPARRSVRERNGSIKLSSLQSANSFFSPIRRCFSKGKLKIWSKKKNKTSADILVMGGFKDDIRAKSASPAPLSPPPQREKQPKKKDALTISCMTKLFVCAERWQGRLQGDTTSAEQGT